MNQTNKTVNYSVYIRKDGKARFINDTTGVQLPSIEMLTDTIKGAGILGEVDMPSPSQIGSMTLAINIRATGEDATDLIVPEAIDIELRWASDRFNSNNGKLETVAHKAFLKVLCKKFDEGKVETNAASDGSYEYEVIYYRRIVNGKEILLIDKFNGDYIVNGTNYGKQFQAAL